MRKNHYRITPVEFLCKMKRSRMQYFEQTNVVIQNYWMAEKTRDFETRVRAFELAMMALGDSPKRDKKTKEEEQSIGNENDVNEIEGSSFFHNLKVVYNRGEGRNRSIKPQRALRTNTNVPQLAKNDIDGPLLKEEMNVYFDQVKKLVVKKIKQCDEQVSIVLDDTVVDGAQIMIQKQNGRIVIEWTARTKDSFNFLKDTKVELQSYLNEKIERAITVNVNYGNSKTVMSD